MSTPRETILQSIAQTRGAAKPVPNYALPDWSADAAAHFIAKAKASAAEVHEIATPSDAPKLILSILSQAKLPPRLHLLQDASLNALAWQRAPGLTLLHEPPGGDDSAFSVADYGIAETGTLVFFSGPQSASSWHFRPGREFVLLRGESILPRLEAIITLLADNGRMPATMNLITGPSRTADIEQTIELGAHGPRTVHILIAG
jgi:L-lactate dehydrogenase complex protein LldG